MKSSTLTQNGVEPGAVDAQARAEGVVAEDAGVAELAAVGLDDDLPLVAEELAAREAHQQPDEREVEHEVARLAQVALLGGDPVG